MDELKAKINEIYKKYNEEFNKGSGTVGKVKVGATSFRFSPLFYKFSYDTMMLLQASLKAKEINESEFMGICASFGIDINQGGE